MDVQQDRDLGTLAMPSLRSRHLRVLDPQGDPVGGVTIDGEAFLEAHPYDFTVHEQFDTRFMDWLVASSSNPLVTNSDGLTSIDIPDLATPDLAAGIKARYTDSSGTKYVWGLENASVDPNGDWRLVLSDVDAPHQVAPSAPTSVHATPNDSSALVSWVRPGDGGSPITSYTVTSSPSGITKTIVAGSNSTSTTLNGLANGTDYTFTVVATNAVGDSPASSPSNQITPAGAPATVTAPTATRGDHSVQLSWTQPSGNGSLVTGYTITSASGGITKTVTGADTLSTTLGGLANGTAYTFTVVATNAIGNSPASAPSNSVIPAGTPLRMRAPKVLIQGSKAIVKWTAAVANGSPITQYKVNISMSKDKVIAAGARKTVYKGLKPGRYRVCVTARNGIGTAPYSAWTKFRIR